MNKNSNIEIKSLTNMHELCQYALRYKNNTLSLEEIQKLVRDHFLFGYEVYVGRILRGFAFAMLVDGYFTLDGYNEGAPVFTAVKTGRMVVDRLFKDYADIAYTGHTTGDRALDALVKRIGFRKIKSIGGETYFEMKKSWA